MNAATTPIASSHSSRASRGWTALLLAFASTGVMAHAVVVTAVPAAKSIVSGEEIPVDLVFNSRIDAGRSRLTVIDREGTPTALSIDTGAPPNHLRARARALAAGPWVLEWYVLSTDGHITRGRLKFEVSPGE